MLNQALSDAASMTDYEQFVAACDALQWAAQDMIYEQVEVNQSVLRVLFSQIERVEATARASHIHLPGWVKSYYMRIARAITHSENNATKGLITVFADNPIDITCQRVPQKLT